MFSKTPFNYRKEYRKEISSRTVQNNSREHISGVSNFFFDKQPQPLWWAGSRAAVHNLVGRGFDTYNIGDEGQATCHIRIYILV